MNPKILVILGSTRDGRLGTKVSNWAMPSLSNRNDASFELIDLKEWNFPLFNISITPSTEKGKYANTIQENWGKKVESADGFVLITPEYNHGYSAALKNALDYLWFEWNTKPVSFISYGGISGGLRAVEQLRQVAVELEMVPIRQQVMISHIYSSFEENGNIKNAEQYNKQLNSMADALVKWSNNLKSIRENPIA